MTRTDVILLIASLVFSPAIVAAAQDARDDAAAAAAAAPAAATSPTSHAAEIRRGAPMGGSSEERNGRFYENVIRKVEPSLKGDLARLPLYVELFKREFIEDTRTFAIDLTAVAMANGSVTVNGRVEFDEHRRSLGEFLKHLGFVPNVDGVGLYPSAALGEKQYAVVRAEHAFVYARPVGPRETLTDSLKGDGLFLLAPADNGHFLCHAPDGYVGYVSGDAIEQMTAEQFDVAMNPSGGPVIDPRVEGAIDAASRLMGTKYVWGGMTREGIDCSGLVHTAFRSQGLHLPRDADQQALAGKLVATRWHRSTLRRGDVLFFLGRRGTISHTAIYLGNNEYIEATSPVVTVSSFDPSSPKYSKRRDEGFCFAKRVFD